MRITVQSQANRALSRRAAPTTLDPVRTLVVQAVAFIGLGVLCHVAERRWPARLVPYRLVLRDDLLALGVYLCFFVGALSITSRIPLLWSVHAYTGAVPMALRVVAFVLVVDLGDYWMHRLWHTRWLWRVHRWHHSPPHLYWLSGIRGSLPQTIMGNLPFTLALPLLLPAPPAFFTVWGCLLVLKNDWMHLNVAWRLRWLEWLFVTPVYHHVHHGNHRDLYDRNFGVLLTIWDRLFGTWRDPDTVPAHVGFGIPDKVSEPRMAIGV
jgi:sterol desaturase/sphingolipid hydroxylase (fatty acid hydroxylase superfamily)